MRVTNYPDVNVCEHGDHPAPDGQRFCSEECKRCEMTDADFSIGCAGICLARKRAALSSSAAQGEKP